ncbi:hypothetical protein EJK20_10270 [Lactobacillus xujianguonis]|nr:hypothetical protein EJK20_10270 [Lactobacillus xujianguonis]
MNLVSKNNIKLKNEKAAEREQHFGFRKLTTGAIASVLLGTALYMGTTGVSVKADTTVSDDGNTETINQKQAGSGNDSNITSVAKSNDKIVTQDAQNQARTDATESSSQESAATTADNKDAAQATQDATSIKVTAANDQKATDSKKSDEVELTKDLPKEKINPNINEKAKELLDSKISLTATNNSASDSVTIGDNARLSISRNTIGATDDTSPFYVDFYISNPNKGDQYQIEIPKGSSYSIKTDGQNIQVGGTTTISDKDNSRIVVDDFTDDNAGTIHQRFTLDSDGNFAFTVPVPMLDIGNVLKKITITKKDKNGSSESKELGFTQIIKPEMSPEFKRLYPKADPSIRVLPNTDYTYELKLNETTGTQKQGSEDPLVIAGINTNTVITIPVPDSFVLNRDKTNNINNFGDQTTITQVGGRGSNIIIHVPKGSGNRRFAARGYMIVGHYETDQPVNDTVIQANTPIHIDQTITKGDGQTYHLIKDLQPWTETLLGSKSDDKSSIVIYSGVYNNDTHSISQDVDPSRPINTFGFANNTNQDITNAQITLTFPDGLNINRIATPGDPVELPGTTSYAYQVTYTDGSTSSGNVQAGQSINAAGNRGIAKIVITPNVISAGISFNRGIDNKYRIRAYGTVNPTLANGQAIENGHEFNSTIGFQYNKLNNDKIITVGPLNAVQKYVASIAGAYVFKTQYNYSPDAKNAGTLTPYLDDDSVSSNLPEPIFYYVLPEGTVYNNVFSSHGSQYVKPRPKITNFEVDGQEVVKVDYTGTGYKLVSSNDNTIHVDNLPLAEIGSHKWAIYMYSPHVKMTNGLAKDYSGWKSAQTEGKTDDVYFVGDGTWNISIADQVQIASGIKGPDDAFSLPNTTANDKHPGQIEYDFKINNTLHKLNDGVTIVNINDGDTNNFDFEMTEPVAVPNGYEVLYSTQPLVDNNKSTGHLPSLSNYVSWDQIADKSKIKSVAVKFASLDKNTSTPIFKIKGTDRTFKDDAEKSVSFSPTLYTSNLNPTGGKTSSIKIEGKSTVKVELVDPDGNVIDDVDLSNLDHTYKDNIDQLNEQDFDLSDSNKEVIKNYLTQLDSQDKDHHYYQLQPPIIVTKNGSISRPNFGDTVKSEFDNNVVVQYRVQRKDMASAIVTYFDQDTGGVLEVTDQIYGIPGDAINYSTAATIKKYTDKGYVFVSNDFDQNGVPGKFNKVIDDHTTTIPIASFSVYLRHGVQKVTAETKRSELPANATIDPSTLRKTITEKVTYENDDLSPFTGEQPSNAEQSITFNGTVYVDLTNGQLVHVKEVDDHQEIDHSVTAAVVPEWKTAGDKTAFAAVTSPIEEGYHVSNVSAHADATGSNVGEISVNPAEIEGNQEIKKSR